MNSYDIIVIGGGPAGIVLATTVRRQHPEKSVLLITCADKGVVPCGIPYVFHELGHVDKNTMSPAPLKKMGGEVLVDPVQNVDVAEKTVRTESGKTITYDKLIFATGSRPFVPTFIPGYDLADHVGYVPKSYDGIAKLKQQTDQAKSIIILGSGFTAVEMAEQLARDPEKDVHLVYRAKHCLMRSFSPEIAQRVDDALCSTGVNLHPNCQVTKILGGDQPVGIELSDGQQLHSDFVIVGMGYRPCSELASQAGLQIGEHGGIMVDNYLRTSNPDVFAVGDCAQTSGFITGRDNQIMLASTGAAEARILGYNLYSMRIMRNFPGTLSVFSTEIGGLVLASAGVIEPEAQAAGIDYVIGRYNDIDRHPAGLDGVSSIGAKLIISAGNGQIIGGELYGGKSIGEMINTLALAIQKNVTVYELMSFQLGTHPKLTAAPTKPILIKAAERALTQLSKIAPNSEKKPVAARD